MNAGHRQRHGLISASVVSAITIWAIGSSAEGPSGDELAHYNGSTWDASE
jgi:hypothetical protein